MALNEGEISTVESPTQAWVLGFESGGNLVMDDATGGAWFVTQNYSNGLAGDDLKVLLAQVTTDGEISGTLLVQVFENGVGSSDLRFHLSFEGTDGSGAAGCTDPNADNYNSGAAEDDGSCLYGGCTDPVACNYDLEANDDDGSCVFADPFRDCAGDCISDADGDGFCDEEEVDGCTDQTAWNYDSNATEEDNSCIYFNACNLEADAVVEASSFDFEPSLLNLDVGATVVWVNVGGLHNVNATTDQLTGLPFDNPQPFSIPAVLGSTEGTCLGSFTFTVPGVYDYNSSVSNQASLGMVGTIIVGAGGCNDQDATNYDPTAEFDDGSCIFSGCTDPLASNYDANAQIDNGSCLYPGCTDASAANYDASANDDDGSCLYTGCTDATAANYDPQANTDDGSCFYPGCTDAEACNYDSSADTDDGSCLDAPATWGVDYLDCDGLCLNDADSDGVCDEDEVDGCNDANACNFDVTATEDDGTCDYCSCAGTGGDTTWVAGDTLTVMTFTDDTVGYALDVEWVANHTTGALTGMSTFRLYVVANSASDLLSSCFGNSLNPMVIQSTEDFYQDPIGSTYGTGINALLLPAFPSVAFDSWVTIGLDGTPPPGYSNIQSAQSPGQNWVASFDAGGELRMDDAVGGAWFVTSSNLNGVPDGDLRVLVAQFTTSGVVSGSLPVQIFPLGDGSNEERASFTFTTEGLGQPELTAVVGTGGDGGNNCGCTDVTADNYDETAEFEDGTCQFLGCTNPNGLNYDSDANTDDGSCIVPGCTNVEADNYDPEANQNDGSCILSGCTYSDAANYDPTANTDDGSCIYYGCIDPEADNFDPTANVDDGGCMYLGCTDSSADNFDPSANQNDGTCEYLGCTVPVASNFDPTANVDDGSCLFPGCTNPDAANYDATANDDDGSCILEGCLDVTASNYDAGANTDDGSCLYPGCTDSGASNFDPDANLNDGTCLFPGCLDSDALNYDSAANVDDGSCQYGGCIDPNAVNYDDSADVDNGTCLYAGCTDAAASNYDSGANQEDGSCIYPGCTDNTAVNFDVIANEDDGSCLFGGCMDPGACNYDADADVEDGSCFYPNVVYVDCDGNCLNDEDGDGVCDEDEFSGCTDALACNYNANMTEDDGSCEYCSCSEEGPAGLDSFEYETNEAGYGLELSRVMDHSTGPLAGMTTWRLTAKLNHVDDMLSSVYGNDELPLQVSSTAPFYQDLFGGTFANGVNPLLLPSFPDLAYDSWVTIGIESTANSAAGEGDIQSAQSPGQNWVIGFDAGGEILMNDPTGGAWFVTNVYNNGIAGDDLEVLLGQFTTAGELTGVLNYQVFLEGNGANDVRVTASFSSADLEGEEGPACGCLDETADNYDSTAVYDDGSCETAGCTDAAADNYDSASNVDDGSCLFSGCTDPDGFNYDPTANSDDGSCIFFGCTHPFASNYDPAANFDDGSCVILGCTISGAENYNPEATDNDGSCIFAGCTNVDASNYDPLASIDDGSCVVPGCTDASATNYNPDATFNNGSCEFLGCTDATACNYDALALTDDGSCTYPIDLYDYADYDCNGDCISDIDEDGICDAFEIPGCTDFMACNYAGATDDDGSCDYLSCAGCSDPEADNYDSNALIVNDDLCEYLGCTNPAADNYDGQANVEDDSCLFSGCTDPRPTTTMPRQTWTPTVFISAV